MRARRERDPDGIRAYEKARYAENPEFRRKRIARSMVIVAVERGRLKREPCEVCGVDVVEAHHDDYSLPLDVRWLCPTHHVAHHAAERGA